MKSHQAQTSNYAQPPNKRRGLGCLIWGIPLLVGLCLSAFVVLGAIYVGWSSGVATAQANSTGTAEAALQRQCERVPLDLATGNLGLAETRLKALASETPAPSCLHALIIMATAMAPTATTFALPIRPSPTALPTFAATSTIRATIPTSAPVTDIVGNNAGVVYDLDALLAEARNELSQQNYLDAIDTLDAIISVDEDFQSELVRRLFLEALKFQAQALFRSGKLSQAIVLTGRAETLGSIESLQYERFIALLYLDGQRLKVTNPAEAVRLFNRIVYEQGLANYMNGDVIAEMQEALRNYAVAFAYQGEPCRARDQYDAALGLHPTRGLISRGELTNKRQEAAHACGDQPLSLTTADTDAAVGTPLPIGVRSR